MLDGVYESMPSLPGLVLTARLLNRQQKREDTPQNSFEAIMEMTNLLCSIDLERSSREEGLTSASRCFPSRCQFRGHGRCSAKEPQPVGERERGASDPARSAQPRERSSREEELTFGTHDAFRVDSLSEAPRALQRQRTPAGWRAWCFWSCA